MSEAFALKILRCAFASLQDGGRVGFEHLGVARAGFADTRHAPLANLLCGNAPEACVIEIFAGAFSAEFLGDIDFVIAGATAEISVSGQAVQVGRRMRARRGQCLQLHRVEAGRVLYLALAGGVACAPVMGSWSTDLAGAFGGFDGRLLRAGDVVAVRASGDFTSKTAQRSGARAWLKPQLPRLQALRFLAHEDADAALIERFCAGVWTLTAHANRMGSKLSGTALQNGVPQTDGVSRGVLPGLIQLPPNGMPIILGPDAQTIGGYFVLGVIIRADLWRVIHFQTADVLRFAAITRVQAQQANHQFDAELARIEIALNASP
jgi:5-oxoprolinase (ATP-hydrolysing) subunit C